LGCPLPWSDCRLLPPRVDVTVLVFMKWSYHFIIVLLMPLRLIAEVIKLCNTLSNAPEMSQKTHSTYSPWFNPFSIIFTALLNAWFVDLPLRKSYCDSCIGLLIKLVSSMCQRTSLSSVLNNTDIKYIGRNALLSV
jgi:hypothetical protein